MIDFHCHLLPGLDDGVESLAEGLRIAYQLLEAGFTTVVATPHVLEGRAMLAPQEITSGVREFNQALQEEKLGLQVVSGAENYLFPAMAEFLKQGRLQSVAGQGKHLLLELPAWEIPPYTEQVFFDLQVAGVTPILAHPERYPALRAAPERVYQWVIRLGVLTQLDLRSLSGRYGPGPKEGAEFLAAHGLVHFAGSDAHRPSGARSPYQAELEALRVLSGESGFWAIMKDNPQKVLLGEALPPPAEPLVFERSKTPWQNKLARLFRRKP